MDRESTTIPINSSHGITIPSLNSSQSQLTQNLWLLTLGVKVGTEQAGAVLGLELEGRPPGVLEAGLGTAADTASLLALEWESDALIVRGAGERDGVKRDRRQTLGSDSSRKGPALQGAGGEEQGQGRKLPGHRLQLNSETHFPLLFN